MDFGPFLKRAFKKRCFRLFTTLRVYNTSHSGQLYKLLFVPNTGRGRRYDIIHKVGVDTKYDGCATYRTLGPRISIISIVNIDFDIVPQGPRNGPAMVEPPVKWS